MLQRAEAVEGMRCGKLSARLPVYDLKETRLIPAGAILYARKVRKGINLYTECGEFLNRQKLGTVGENLKNGIFKYQILRFSENWSRLDENMVKKT